MSQLLEIEKPSVTMSITSKSNSNMSTNSTSQTTLTAPLPDVLANGDHAIKIKTDSVRGGEFSFFAFCYDI